MADGKPALTTGQEQTQEQAEAQERLPRGEVARRVEGVTARAREVYESLKDTPDVEALRALRPDLPPAQQAEGLALMQTQLVNLLARIADKKESKELQGLRPAALMDEAMLYEIEPTPLERLAWQKYTGLALGSGPTADYVGQIWKGEEGLLKQGEYAARGLVGKLGKYAYENKGKTALIVVGVLGGAYVGYRVLNWISGLFKKGEKEETPKEQSRFWGYIPGGKMGLAFALMALGLIGGRKELMALIKDMSKEELAELMKQGKSLPERAREKLEEAVTERQQQIDEAKDKAGAAVDKAKAATEAAVQRVGTEVVDPANRFQAGKEIFLKLYFYNEREFEVGKRQAVIDAINELKDTSLGIFNDVTEADVEAKIRSRLKTNNTINQKHLWYLVSHLQELRKHFPDATDGETVQDLFIRIFNDPIQKINEHLHSEILDKVKNGNFGDIANIDFGALDKKILDNAQQTIDALNARLKIDTTVWNDEDKRALHSIQWQLFSEGGLSKTPDEAIQEAMSLRGLHDLNPAVIQTATQFYAAIRDTMPDLIDKSRERFEIKTFEGRPVPESEHFIQNGFSMENINFRNGALLVLAAEGMQWDAKQKEKVHWMKDLALMNLIFRCMPAADRNRYIGRLAKMIANAEIDIHLPQLGGLKPYFESLKDYAVEKGVNHGLGVLERSIDFRDHPPHEAADFKRRLKEHPWMTFAAEAGSGGLEIASDALALIIATLGITPKDFSGVQSAEDLFHLIISKGGTVVYPVDKETGKISATQVLIHVGMKYVWAKPIGIIKESLSWENIKNADLGDMLTKFLILDAPFIALGAANGAFRSTPHLWQRIPNFFKGAGQGLLYPVKAPLWGVKAVGHVVDAAASGTIAVKEYAGRPLQWANDFKFWIGDKATYGILSEPQNVTNLMRDIRLFDHYYRGAGDTLQPMEFRKKILQWFEDPKNAVRRLGSSFNKRMAFRYAERFRLRYGRFFDFTGQKLANPVWVKEINATNIGHLREAANRLDRSLKNLIADAEYQGLKMRVQQGGVRFNDALRQTLGQLFERAGFSKDANEVESLMRQIKDETALKHFIDKVEKGTPEIGGAPATETPFRKPTEIAKRKYRYLGEEFSFREDQIETEAKKLGGSREKAIEKLCHREWTKPRMVSEGPKGRLYRYRGGEFVLTPAEYRGQNATGITRLCETKYIQSIQVSDVKVLPDGTRRYKIGNEWVEMTDKPDSLRAIKEKYFKALKESGRPIEFKDLGNTRLLKYMPVLEKMLGPAVAAFFIYHLETANDKRKAVAEGAVGLGAFYAGMKGTDWAVGKRLTNPMIRFVVDVSGGIAAAMGFTEPISNIVLSILPHFTGEQQVGSEIISLFEKQTGRGLSRQLFVSLERGALRKGVEKIGMKKVGELLAKKVESTALKKVGEFASKSFLKKLAVSLGVKGATLVALLADDATVIGVLDDVVAVGMAAWMAKDVYDIAVIANTALKIKTAMAERGKRPIDHIEFVSEVDRKAFEDKVTYKGKTLETLTDDEIMEVVQSLPQLRIKIMRTGIGGYEEYQFVKGEVYSMKIVNPDGKVHAELEPQALHQQIALEPPQEFQPIEIDSRQPDEKLLATYRLAIVQMKSECGWTHMDYEIADKNTVRLKRLDNAEALTLKGQGNSWNIENVRSGLTFYQAVVMGNLLNKVKGMIQQEGHQGEGSHPFTLDAGSIDFNRSWNPVDLRILDGDKQWLNFYNAIGLTKWTLVETLNTWYASKEGAIEQQGYRAAA